MLAAVIWFCAFWALLELTLGQSLAAPMAGPIILALLVAMAVVPVFALVDDLTDDDPRQGPYLILPATGGGLALLAAAVSLPPRLQAVAVPPPMDAIFEQAHILFYVMMIGMAGLTAAKVLRWIR